MAILLKRSFEFYTKAMVEWPDPESKGYPLLDSPIKVLSIIVLYLLFCLEIGPKFMENRKPYDVRKYIIVYNIFQILSNASLAIIATPLIFRTNWRCSPIAYKYGNESLTGALSFTYFSLKVLDLVDTVFFILRKNQRQVTFLHLYHHVMMVASTWLSAKYLTGGHSIYVPYINLIVHTAMYSYYLLCVLSEKHRKNVWWKKHITQLQILQFGLIFLIYFQLLFRDCQYPRTFTLMIVIQNLTVTGLFLDFYYKTYIKKKI